MPSYLPSSYNPQLVAFSFLVAIFASFVALDLARRVTESSGLAARIWLIFGSLVMGSGIWSMHFVGMLAFVLPIPLGYDWLITVLSWIAAVSSSGIALHIASRKNLHIPRLMLGSLAMGIGISLMHYAGMLAMRMQPAIHWNPWLLGLSIAMAIGASFAALLIFFWMRSRPAGQVLVWQALASLMMGSAIVAMHYTGMAAANFPLGSICRSAYGVNTQWLGYALGGFSFLFLATTLMTALLDARLQAHIAALNKSLDTANHELLQSALRDPLTHLPNRLIFENYLDHMVSQVSRSGSQFAIMLVNLDGFKLINDTLGYQSGDEVLKQIALRLQEKGRASDTIARIGSDDFVVLADTEGQLETATSLAQRIINIIGEPLLVNGSEIFLTCSIGISLYPDDGPVSRMIGNADAAMHQSKRSGKSTFNFYSPSMNTGKDRLLSMQYDLKTAIAHNRLALYYQPKIDAVTRQIVGVEALLRWHHPNLGMVSPTEFVPLAEHCGLIVPLGNWVIDAAIRQVADWMQAGRDLPVAINLSAHQLNQPDLLQRITEALNRHQVPAELVMLEITESVIMQNAASSLELMKRLTDIGIHFSIDDFGTGYSSLSYLRRFVTSQLKIDRSFILDVEHNEDARAIVGAIVKLAHALGMHVVAEWVENRAQYHYLQTLGCDQIQGFLFSRPVPSSEIAAMGDTLAGDE